MSFGKASPYLASAKFCELSQVAGRRSVSRSPWACKAGVAMQEPRSQVRPAPHPVAASLPLGGAWEGSRCSAYAPTCQPRAAGREGDKSLEAVPRPAADVQHALQANPGLDRMTPRREQSFHRVQLFAVQKTAALPGAAVFAFVGLRNAIASYTDRFCDKSVFCRRKVAAGNRYRHEHRHPVPTRLIRHPVPPLDGVHPVHPLRN